jgi:nucleotide-binding universal stress UspA family protein
MFKKILVAVDGSQFAGNAITYALKLAGEFKSEVFVVHVHERELGRAGAFPLESLQEAEKVVADTVKRFADAGVPTQGEVQHALVGHAAKHIVDTAVERRSDLIVMGSRGLSDIAGLLLGSVTHKVLQLAQVPVFVARGPRTEAEKELVGVGVESARG